METLAAVWQAVWGFLQKYTIVWVALAALAAVCAVGMFICACVLSRRRRWDSLFFRLLCAVVFYWAVCAGLPLLPFMQAKDTLAAGQALYLLRHIGIAFMPGLVYLHVLRQVSYKTVKVPQLVLCLLPPVCLSAAVVMGAAGRVQPYGDAWNWGTVVYGVWCAVIVAGCLQHLLSVFYQMPVHMRRSSRYMLAGVVIAAVAGVLWAAAPWLAPYDVLLAATLVMLLLFYHAMGITSAFEVIVTSREYVLNNLSTHILVLNPRMRILDWNHPDQSTGSRLPMPVYREQMDHYRSRIITEAKGRVSAQDANVITLPAADGGEAHYLLTLREARGHKRMYGYIVEIALVSPLFSIMRYLEEIATVDQLTGLHNRNAYLRQVVQWAVPGCMPMAVVVGDVNNLKPINDVHGHLAGDELLVTVAGLIREQLPAGAFAARIGGDEFVLLMPRTEADQARAFIEAAHAGCAKLPQPGGMQTSVSWGFAVMQQANEDYNAMFSQADAMMYASKKGRSQFRSAGLLPGQQGAAPAAVPPGGEDAKEGPAPQPPLPPPQPEGCAPEPPAAAPAEGEAEEG